MPSCEGVRLPREAWEQVFHAPHGGIDASVLANGMENVPPGGQARTANTVGKSFLLCFAHLDLNGQSSIGQSFAETAETDVPAVPVYHLNPVALAYPNILPGLSAEDGWDDMEVPLGPVNPMWRDIVIEFSRTRKYSGLICEQRYSGNEGRLQMYKDRVQQAITLYQGPRVYKTNIDMVATYSAVAMCEGRAQETVTQFLENNRRLPLKRELFFLLDEDIFTVYTSGSSSEAEIEQSYMVRTHPGHSFIPSYMS
jgi:hypothetical protein